jgi:hypothetical protein
MKILPISMLVLALPMLMLQGLGSEAYAGSDSDQVITELLYRLDNPQAEDAEDDKLSAFLHRHKEIISTDPEAAVAAVILARREGLTDLATTIATTAINRGASSPRLIYELGFTLLLDGECNKAKPIFKAFIDGRLPAPDWIVTESRRSILLCPDAHLWFYDISMELGYDDNLAGVTTSSQVVPEEGSTLGNLIDELSIAYPDLTLNRSLVIGERPVSGFWSRTSIFAQHHYIDEATRGLISLTASQRLTTPRGYEATGFNLGWITEEDTEQVTQIKQIDVFHNRREQGPERRKNIIYGLTAFSGLEWRRQKYYRVGLFYGWHNRRSSSDVVTSPLGLRMRILSNTSSPEEGQNIFKAYPWWVEVEGRSVDSQQAINRMRGYKISSSIGPLPLTSSLPITLTGFYDQSKRDAPQPWLKDRHWRRQYNLNLVAQLTYGDIPFDLVFVYDQITSKDVVEVDEKLSIFLRFSPIY